MHSTQILSQKQHILKYKHYLSMVTGHGIRLLSLHGHSSWNKFTILSLYHTYLISIKIILVLIISYLLWLQWELLTVIPMSIVNFNKHLYKELCFYSAGSTARRFSYAEVNFDLPFLPLISGCCFASTKIY